MKTKEDILKSWTGQVTENGLKAMEEYSDQTLDEYKSSVKDKIDRTSLPSRIKTTMKFLIDNTPDNSLNL